MIDPREQAEINLRRAASYGNTDQDNYLYTASAFVYAILHLADKIGEKSNSLAAPS